MVADGKRLAAKGAALTACILLPLCGCATIPPNFDDGRVFESTERPTPKSKASTKLNAPAVARRSESANDSELNPVQQVGNVDSLPVFSGRAQRSEAVR